MKRFKLIPIIAVLIIVICNICACSEKKNKTIVNVPQYLAIETFANNFIKAHPNYFQNEIIQQKMDEQFKKDLIDSLNKGNLFEGVPFKLEHIFDLKKGKYFVDLEAWQVPANFSYFPYIHELGCDVVGIISEKQMQELKTDSFYTFKGRFIGDLTHGTLEVLSGYDYMVYTNEYGLEKEEYLDSAYNVKCGILYFDIDTIMPFKSRPIKQNTVYTESIF